MPVIQSDALYEVVRTITEAAGSLDAEARVVAANLVEANLTGHDSHGVGMLPRYIQCVHAGSLKPNQEPIIDIDHGNIVVIDGGSGYGQAIGAKAMAIAIERTREHGVCVLAIRRSFHLCRIGAWAEQLAEAGLVSMHHVMAVGGQGLVAPFGGTDARYTTNPYCAALPGTGNNPATVLDMATSIIAQGKVRVAHNKGESLDEGVLLDGQGRPTTDPGAMFRQPRGAIMPFAEHKGYGLALINELFAGVLSGGQTCRPETQEGSDGIINNMLSVVIDPMRLVSEAFFNAEVDATIAHVKASPAQDPAKPVLVPGDPERLSSAFRSREGVPVDAETWRQILTTGQSVGVSSDALERIAGANRPPEG